MTLAETLRSEGGLLAAAVAPDAPPDGEGPYAAVLAAIREGYEQHYGEGRVLRTEDRDLALLAGDRLYALGLALLAEQRGRARGRRARRPDLRVCECARRGRTPARAEAAWARASVRVARRRLSCPAALSGDIVRRPSPIGTPVRV